MSPYLEFVKVHALAGAPSRGVLVAGPDHFDCALGRSGITHHKREGDGATPSGSFALRRVYFRPDRAGRPVTGLPVEASDPDLGWSDDPADPCYNSPVRLPHAASHERMWRDDDLYDFVVVIGHNDAPPHAPCGSAIFLHLARPGYQPTEGCVALARPDMLALLPRLGPRTRIIISG